MNIATNLFSAAPSAPVSHVMSGGTGVAQAGGQGAQGAFYQLLSSFASVELEGDSAAQNLLENLYELLELISSPDRNDVFEAEGAEQDASFDELIASFDEKALIQYLDQFFVQLEEYNAEDEQLLDTSHVLEQLEQLYDQFLLIPIQTAETSFVSSQQVSGQTSSELVSAIAKWGTLFEAFLVSKQHTGLEQSVSRDDSLLQQVQRVAALAHQNTDLKSILTERLNQEAFLSAELTAKNEQADTALKGPSFLPVSLLKESKAVAHHPTTQVQQDSLQPVSNPSAGVTAAVPQEAELGSLVSSAKTGDAVPLAKTEDVAQQTVRFSHLLEDIQNVMKQQLRMKTTEEGTQIRLKLSPEHLGQLDIRITSTEGKIHAQLLASSQMAREALELSVGQLRVALQQQGIQVDRIEISQQDSLNHSLQDHREGQAFAQHQQQSSSKKDAALGYQSEEQLAESEILEEGLEQSIDFRA